MKIITGKIDFVLDTFMKVQVTDTCSSDFKVGKKYDLSDDKIGIGDKSLYNLLRNFINKKIMLSYFISPDPLDNLTEEDLVKLDIIKQVGAIESEAGGITVSIDGYSSITITGIYISGTDVFVGGHNLSNELSLHRGQYCRMEVTIINN